MKRLICLLLVLLTLCGCGLRENVYIKVEPHDEDYEVSQDSDAVTVGSYLALKNAILYFVEEGMEKGVIYAEAYSGNITEDLEQAVYEVSKSMPIGAFAVETMTYDYSRIVSYYEIHIHTTFSRDAEEVDMLGYASDTAAVREYIAEAMKHYDGQLLLRVGDYDPFDIETVVEEIYLAHPEYALEKPIVSMNTYPEKGTQRILEIRFAYKTNAEVLMEKQQIVAEHLERIASIYGIAHNDMTNAKRFYARVGRDAVLIPDLDDLSVMTNSPYGVLEEKCSTSYGFAQTYLLLLRATGVECELISGVKDGAVHYWCLVNLGGDYYYVDPSLSCNEESGDSFLLGDAELEELGYYSWRNPEQPQVILPDYLRPVQPTEILP